MSIYPVSVKEWYDDKESAFYTERDTLKMILKFYKCETCGKSLKNCWRKVWVHHSITFGYGDAWCSKKCMESLK